MAPPTPNPLNTYAQNLMSVKGFYFKQRIKKTPVLPFSCISGDSGENSN